MPVYGFRLVFFQSEQSHIWVYLLLLESGQEQLVREFPNQNNQILVIVSFLWGSVVYHEDVKNIGLAVVGLLLLLIGIGGLSFSNTNYVKNYGRKQGMKKFHRNLLNLKIQIRTLYYLINWI